MEIRLKPGTSNFFRSLAYVTNYLLRGQCFHHCASVAMSVTIIYEKIILFLPYNSVSNSSSFDFCYYYGEDS